MNQDNFLPLNTPVDVSNCDQEPIHIPGSIQPHGIMIVCQEPKLNIIQISQNTFEIVGIPPEDILGKTLKILFNNSQIQLIKKSLAEISENINPLELYIHTQKGRKTFDGIIHKSDELIVIELEPVSGKINDFLTFYKLVQPIICKMQRLVGLDEFCQNMVKEIRNLTGFDRVMVYKFDPQGAGEVIAEDKLESLDSFMGLHYPASDIPKQARKLYTLNVLRLIPDVNYQSVKLISIDNSVNNQPLDLSGSVLRSVSPIHIEYLKNMGVNASMSISLIREQKLWGLIACHHYLSPQYISYKLRTACELLGRVIPMEIAAKEENEYLAHKLILQKILSNLLNNLTEDDDWIEALIENRSQLLELVTAQGVVVCNAENIKMIGKTPILKEVKNILEYLNNYIFNQCASDYMYVTDCLPQIYPTAENFTNVASGLLAVMISQEHKQYILWFRSEVMQTVNWAGNPHKPVEINADGNIQLSPRKSFDLWQETVKLKSLPWDRCEIEVVQELRNIIVGLVFKKSEKISKIHQQLMLALQSAKMGVWDWDLLQNHIVWSIGHNQLFGLVELDSIDTYEGFKSLIDPRDRESVDLAINQALVEQHDYYQDFRVVWPDGSSHWLQGRGKFFLNDVGEAVRFLGTVVEISDVYDELRKRKLAEIQLQELNLDLENRVKQRTLELENSQAALQQQVKQQQLVMAIALRIRQSLHLHEILNTAVTEVREFIHADRVFIYRFEPDYSGYIVVESVSDDWNSALNVKIEDTCFMETREQKYKQTDFQAIADIYTADLTKCYRDLLAQFQIKAHLVVPIFRGETLWGLLVSNQCETPRNWQPWEIDFLQQLATQVGIAIQQSELYQQLEQELIERQQIETALRGSENLFRSLNEFAPVGIFKTSSQGKMLYNNSSCQQICGFTLEQSLGNSWINFIHPEDLEVFLPQWNAGVSTHHQLSTEIRFVHENKAIRICRLIAVPIFSDANEFLGYVGTIEDITDEQAMDKMKNEFISIVSHELRTPLTSIRSSLGLLTTSSIRNQPEKMQKILEIASSNTERLTRLLNDILDLERLETNKFILHKKSCDAMKLISNAVESMQTKAQEENICLQILPGSGQVWVDVDRILQTLINLISNAIKFSPPHTTIKLSVEEMPDSYLFKIQDQGRGIPKDKLESIFCKFQQIDATDSREKGGTGLGLAICRNIIQQHGGKIWAESVLGKSSTFYFSIPKLVSKISNRE
ncbi:GAF domain-containing protein [Okeanomitos corallinicola TIOX110]|uniref:histidine kinase n=1 Tax=Okeanomitos corallinicola TIOX110 TaxID=3133117 RepID=A0ABZ2UR01_9CYAN